MEGLADSALFARRQAALERDEEAQDRAAAARAEQARQKNEEQAHQGLLQRLGWEEAWDAARKCVYYHNTRTAETRWEVPSVAELQQATRAVERPWIQLTTDDGSVYYHNEETGQTSWVAPSPPASEASRATFESEPASGARRIAATMDTQLTHPQGKQVSAPPDLATLLGGGGSAVVVARVPKRTGGGVAAPAGLSAMIGGQSARAAATGGQLSPSHTSSTEESDGPGAALDNTPSKARAKISRQASTRPRGRKAGAKPPLELEPSTLQSQAKPQLQAAQARTRAEILAPMKLRQAAIPLPAPAADHRVRSASGGEINPRPPGEAGAAGGGKGDRAMNTRPQRESQLQPEPEPEPEPPLAYAMGGHAALHRAATSLTSPLLKQSLKQPYRPGANAPAVWLTCG